VRGIRSTSHTAQHTKDVQITTAAQSCECQSLISHAKRLANQKSGHLYKKKKTENAQFVFNSLSKPLKKVNSTFYRN